MSSLIAEKSYHHDIRDATARLFYACDRTMPLPLMWARYLIHMQDSVAGVKYLCVLKMKYWSH